MFPAVSSATIAAQMGISHAQYQGVLVEFDRAVKRMAATLLAERDFAAQINALPFAPGDTVVALGDSITDDLQSWFEILRTAFAMARPAHEVTFVNAGISGETTTAMLSRFYGITLLQPQWILCLAGTNDTRTHGLEPARTLVSHDETVANYQLLRDFAQRQTSARWLWLTPPPVIEMAIGEDWWLGPQQIMWRNATLRALAEHLRSRPEPVADVLAAFGDAPNPDWFLSDGLHPSLAGQTVIVRTVVAALSDMG
jgi:lysophospholipase L1-like esterase